MSKYEINCIKECGNVKCPYRFPGVTARKPCKTFQEPFTNFEKLQTMTLEQFAEWIGWVAQDAFCYGAGLRDHMMLYPFGTMESTIEWLKEPPKEET